MAIGTNGTIAGGTATTSETSSYSDSQSDLESGSEVTSDPAGGPALAGAYTQTSVTTSYAFSQDRSTAPMAPAPSSAAAMIALVCPDRLRHPQRQLDDHDGCRQRLWLRHLQREHVRHRNLRHRRLRHRGHRHVYLAPTASDNLVLTQDYGGTTLGEYTQYDMTVDDMMYENFSDVGVDTLGPATRSAPGQ